MYILFIAQIINRSGDFVMPFLTLLLVRKMGLDYQQAGYSVILATISTIPGSFIGSKISDHIGKKKTYLIFQSIYAVFILLCVFASTPYIFIALICLGCFFNGAVRPIISAIITDILPSDQRKIGFSLSYLGINLGVAIGPIIAGFLFAKYIPLIFIGDAITSFIAVILVYTNVKEFKPIEKEDIIRHSERCETGSLFSVLLKRPKILFFLLIFILFNMCSSQHSFSLPVMCTYIFGDKGSQYYGFLMSVNAITVISLTAYLTHLARNLKPLTTIILSGILYAIGFGMITFIHSLPLFILSTFIWSVGEIMIVINFGAFVASQSPQNYRARFNAVAAMSGTVGSMLSTSFMGSIMKHSGVTAVWSIIFIIGIAGAFGMFLLKTISERIESRVSLPET